MQTVGSVMCLCPYLENLDEFVAESLTRDENKQCKCHGPSLFVCQSWDVFSLNMAFILSVEGLVL